MDLQDKNDLTGIFHLEVKNKNGEVVSSVTEKNVIVNAAKIALAHLISDGAASQKVVKHFAVGTSVTTALATDTQLGNQVFQNDVVSYDFPEDGQVRFNWELGFNDANGYDIAEFGLICSDGTLFAHRVRSSTVFKSDDLSFSGTWTIVF